MKKQYQYTTESVGYGMTKVAFYENKEFIDVAIVHDWQLGVYTKVLQKEGWTEMPINQVEANNNEIRTLKESLAEWEQSPESSDWRTI